MIKEHVVLNDGNSEYFKDGNGVVLLQEERMELLSSVSLLLKALCLPTLIFQPLQM